MARSKADGPFPAPDWKARYAGAPPRSARRRYRPGGRHIRHETSGQPRRPGERPSRAAPYPGRWREGPSGSGRASAPRGKWNQAGHAPRHAGAGRSPAPSLSSIRPIRSGPWRRSRRRDTAPSVIMGQLLLLDCPWLDTAGPLPLRSCREIRPVRIMAPVGTGPGRAGRGGTACMAHTGAVKSILERTAIIVSKLPIFWG